MRDDIPDTQTEAVVHIPWYRNNLLRLVVGSITIAILLVMFSMALYTSSGSAQLDLSRPGYQLVRDQVNQSGAFQSFPASGSVDRETLDEFLELYDKQTLPVSGSDAFSSSALDAQALGIDAPAAGE